MNCKSCETLVCDPADCDCIDCHDNILNPNDEGYVSDHEPNTDKD